MKIYLIALLVFLFFSGPNQLFAQNENVTLLVQSPDGKTVKLVWFVKKWDSTFTGFDIRRKEGLQGWVKLNSEAILPCISTKKSLSVVDEDKNEENGVKAKLYKLLAAHKLHETGYAAFLRKLNDSAKVLNDISNIIAHDYDIALMSGFAYVDHSITKKTDYEYGLFIDGTDRLLAKASWNYGEIPDLNAVTEITSRPDFKHNGIQLMWYADTEKVRSGNVAGFNIYRQGIRMNSAPIQATNSSSGEPEYNWYDKSAVSTIATRYSISAESIFGIEGTIKPYTYDPANHPHEYKKAEVTEVIPLGYYLKDGINIKWTFPKDHEHFLKGFYVEKNSLPGGYKRVSPLLSLSVHEFIDQSSSPVDRYISFRVVAVYTDRTNVAGTEKIYNYFPVREPPQPQNVTVKSLLNDKRTTIYLTWDAAMPGDTITDYYRVYAMGGGANGKLLPVNEAPVTGNTYNYVIQHGSAMIYKFCISAISKNNTESPLSDTVTITAPSLELPQPGLPTVSLDSSRALIRWQYPEISDLKGFRVYQNNAVIASENELKRSTHEFRTSALEPGAAYEYKVRAVAENGVISDFSAPVPVTVNSKK